MKTPKKKPGSPLDAIYRRTDLSPEQIFQALSRLRHEAQVQIEFLIDLVNELDGDTDLEPEPVESNLAGFENCCEQADEAEVYDFDDEDNHDDEWSLGSINPTISGSQRTWASGESADLEDEHDGREPSLCGITAGGPSMDDRDLEQSCEDGELESGIGDFAGLMEQCHGYSGSRASGFARYVA
ncbi:hypothetical protein [Tardiphaga sp.]|uniref:hypothetical protein n=1 Tax=Tardiphaga sp. TaxID=1926292 RepID=UPI002604206A|nr:hypothetical protein [Tardiphaga sp.]MDB5617460.1 hypothetical protein [Tardiphaga sp.]